MNDPAARPEPGLDRDRPTGPEPGAGAGSDPARGRSLPPLDHGDDDWAAPVPQAGRRAVVAAWALLGLTVAGLSFAAGARIGRDRAPAATGGAFPRGLTAGGFGGGLAGGFGGGPGGGSSAGVPAVGGGTVTSVVTPAGSGAAPADTTPAAAASVTRAPTTVALGGLLPGFEAPAAPDATASAAPGTGAGTEARADAATGSASGTELGRVSAVEGRTVTVTGADGQTVVFRLPAGVTPPAVGSAVRADGT